MKTPHRDSITSFSNPLVKQLRSLERKKGRAETGLFLAEGARLISEGLSQGWQAKIIMVSTSGAELPHIKELLKKAESMGCRIVDVPDRLLQKVSRKDNAQSIIAAFEQQHRDLKTLSVRTEGIWLGLYCIRDPGNLGTIIRTADCAGVAGIVLVGTCCDPYSVEAVRASMGSIFCVPFVTAKFDDFNAWRKDAGMSMSAASVNGAMRHDQNDYSGNNYNLD